MLCGALLLAGSSFRIGEAIEYAGAAQPRLTVGNSEEAQRSALQTVMARNVVGEYLVRLGRLELQARSSVRAFDAPSMTVRLRADEQGAPPNRAELGLKIRRDREAEKAADRILLFADVPAKCGCRIVVAEAQIKGGEGSSAIKVIEQAALDDATGPVRLGGLLARVTQEQICQVVGGVCTII